MKMEKLMLFPRKLVINQSWIRKNGKLGNADKLFISTFWDLNVEIEPFLNMKQNV